MDRRKNGLRQYSHPIEGLVNPDLTLNLPETDPRFTAEPQEYGLEPASGISVAGKSADAKIGVQHQKALAETLPPCPQRGFPVSVRARKTR